MYVFCGKKHFVRELIVEKSYYRRHTFALLWNLLFVFQVNWKPVGSLRFVNKMFVLKHSSNMKVSPFNQVTRLDKKLGLLCRERVGIPE